MSRAHTNGLNESWLTNVVQNMFSQMLCRRCSYKCCAEHVLHNTCILDAGVAKRFMSHTYEWVVSLTYESVMCHTHEWVIPHMNRFNGSCRTDVWRPGCRSRVQSRVTHMNGSCHTYKWVIPHVNE